MKTTFDSVLSELVRICETGSEKDKIQNATVVRDLAGCLRLVIRPVSKKTMDRDALEAALVDELGGYFKKPILLTDSTRPDERRLANELMNRGSQWDAFYREPFTSNRIDVKSGKWKKIERRLSKQEWLESSVPTSMPPWDLENGRPAIVTFYSFKGGVGRSTALISCAWQLAASGKRVCVIDLDLEAPGLGALLNVRTERGVLDFLVDFVATDSSNLLDCHAPAAVMGDNASNVDVIPAGNINLSYLEKLSRLDFVGNQTFDNNKSPVQRAMEALLGAIAGELKPAYILLDSRAGLHDLAGLSLHGLAHVDVIVARASEQSYAGLDLTLHALGICKDPEQLLTVMVHTFAPRDDKSEEYWKECATFRNRVYESFVKHIYDKMKDDDPAEDDDDASHTPIVLSYNQDLERFSSLASSKTKEALFGKDFVTLCNRIEELCDSSDTGDEET
jgi:MinD-like ATPase involved in chromosome partitioning or flagellar assembly